MRILLGNDIQCMDDYNDSSHFYNTAAFQPIDPSQNCTNQMRNIVNPLIQTMLIEKSISGYNIIKECLLLIVRGKKHLRVCIVIIIMFKL